MYTFLRYWGFAALLVAPFLEGKSPVTGSTLATLALAVTLVLYSCLAEIRDELRAANMKEKAPEQKR